MRKNKVFLCLALAVVFLLVKHFFYKIYNKNSKIMIYYNNWNAHEDKILRNFLKEVEASNKPHLTVFKNVVDGNNEVGFGHVVRFSDGLKLGDKITIERAEKLLTDDIIKHKKLYDDVLKGKKIKLGIARLLVSHAYNTGTRSATLTTMAIDNYINKDWHTSHYVTSGGNFVQGLENRRKKELKLL